MPQAAAGRDPSPRAGRTGPAGRAGPAAPLALQVVEPQLGVGDGSGPVARRLPSDSDGEAGAVRRDVEGERIGQPDR